MPMSFAGINPAQATALTSLANRQQQTLVPQFAYQRVLTDAAKQQALAALSLNRSQILNQRNLATGLERTDLAARGIQRTALEALNQYRMGTANAMSQQEAATGYEQTNREAMLRARYNQYGITDAAHAREASQINQTIAGLSSAANSLYQANQQKKYASELLDYINGASSGSTDYPTWQYTRSTY